MCSKPVEPKKRSRPDVAARKARNKLLDFTGVVLKPGRGGCSRCGGKCMGVKFPKQDKEGVVKLSRSHQVVRCSSNECAMCWQRDRNSSINHLKLLMCMLRNEERPAYMRREHMPTIRPSGVDKLGKR